MTTDHLRYARLRRRIGSQRHVAALLGLAPLTISRRERGATASIPPEAFLALQAIANTKPAPKQENP